MNYNFNTSHQNDVAKRQCTRKEHQAEKQKAHFSSGSITYGGLTSRSWFLICKLTEYLPYLRPRTCKEADNIMNVSYMKNLLPLNLAIIMKTFIYYMQLQKRVSVQNNKFQTDNKWIMLLKGPEAQSHAFHLICSV